MRTRRAPTMLFRNACAVYAAHLAGYWATVLLTCALDPAQWSTACAKVVARNQLLFTPLVSPLLLVGATTQPLSTPCLLWQIPAAVVLTDLFFYPLHRLLHHPKLYALHAAHHAWERPIGMSALHADPLEHCVVNMTPPLLSGVVVGMNPAVMALWACAASANQRCDLSRERKEEQRGLRVKAAGVERAAAEEF